MMARTMQMPYGLPRVLQILGIRMAIANKNDYILGAMFGQHHMLRYLAIILVR